MTERFILWALIRFCGWRERMLREEIIEKMGIGAAGLSKILMWYMEAGYCLREAREAILRAKKEGGQG
jgi:hypothetical protein